MKARRQAEITRLRAEGAAAFLSGTPIRDCPYAYINGAEWKAGYRAASKEILHPVNPGLTPGPNDPIINPY